MKIYSPSSDKQIYSKIVALFKKIEFQGWRRALAALAEELGSIPSTHLVPHNHLASCPRDRTAVASLSNQGSVHAHGIQHTSIRAKAVTHKINLVKNPTSYVKMLVSFRPFQLGVIIGMN